MHPRLFLTLVLGLALSLVQASPSPASSSAPAERAAPIIDLLHTSWTAREGAPSGVSAIAQTPDGWLWIGSTSGLYKFDGMRFMRAEGAQAPLSANISTMGVLKNGALWIGYKYGGFSLMQDGRMRHYRLEDPATPAGTIFGGASDASGGLWIATSRGLYYLGTDFRLHRPAPSLGAPNERLYSIVMDLQGTLWVKSTTAIYALPRGAARFERRMTATTFGMFGLHPDGSVWQTTEDKPGLSRVNGTDRRMLLEPALEAFGPVMFDHAGSAWVADVNGIVRTGDARASVPLQRLSQEQGLSGHFAVALFEDREHNVWVGTENGLDRFKAPLLRALLLPKYGNNNARPLTGGPGSGAWIDRYFFASPGAEARTVMPKPARLEGVSALYRAPDGTIWAGGERAQLWLIGTASRHRFAPPAGISAEANVYAMAQDSHGVLWVSMGRAGIHTFRDGQWLAGGGVPELATFAASTLAADAQGRVWLGSVNNALAIVEGGRVRRFGTAQGINTGTIVQIVPMAAGAWIGGENGLGYFDGRRFMPVLGRRGEPFTGITGMVFARDGSLWLNGGGGISSIAAAELQRALREPDYRVQFRRFDYRDGLTGTTSPILPVPSAVRSDDGTLWFSTTGGVYAFDPATLPGPAPVSPVAISSLRSGTASYPAANGTRLPPGTGALQVDFTALSYREPERIEFRYRLDGVDHEWHDSEGRRMATYTNLGPGHYRFRVMAATDARAWNEEGAAVWFDIAPTLTQTSWFRTLCVLAVILAAWSLHVLRMRAAARKLAGRMGERIAERERIARELHDTLLQSIQGLILIFWGAVRKLPEEQRPALEAALERADAVVAEGRDRVVGLRTAAVADYDLAQALLGFGEPLASDAGIALQLRTDGTPHKLRPVAADEAYAIAREALWNAFAHARARTIAVTVRYAATALQVTVADDGVGLPAGATLGKHLSSHWGVPGMRERARGLGATLTLESAPDCGTKWTLTIPAAIAYA